MSYASVCRCDNTKCNAEIEHNSDNGWPPGWIILVNADHSGRTCAEEHFCSFACLKSFILEDEASSETV